MFILVLLLAWFPHMLWMVFGEHHLEVLPLTLIWLAYRQGPPWNDCCLFVIVEKTYLDFCLLLVVLTIPDSNLQPDKNYVSLTNISFLIKKRSCFVIQGSAAFCFWALKRLIYEILLKTWPSNITVCSIFVRILDSETSTGLKWELLVYLTVFQTSDKGPIASSNFCSSLTKSDAFVWIIFRDKFVEMIICVLSQIFWEIPLKLVKFWDCTKLFEVYIVIISLLWDFPLTSHLKLLFSWRFLSDFISDRKSRWALWNFFYLPAFSAAVSLTILVFLVPLDIPSV